MDSETVDLRDPERFHDAALGCSLAVVLALALNQPLVAAQIAAIGVSLEGVAQKVDRLAARQPMGPRVVQLSGHGAGVGGAVGTLTAHATLRVNGTASLSPV